MATVYQDFDAQQGVPPSTNYAILDIVQGTNFPVVSLKFDAATEQTIFFYFFATNYGSGNITLRIDWYADTASSGDVIWGAAIAAITPNADAQNIETDAFAVAQTVTDTHIGTEVKRLHTIDLTVSNLDGVANGDWVCLKVYRDADAAGDTMTGYARLTRIRISYSDT